MESASRDVVDLSIVNEGGLCVRFIFEDRDRNVVRTPVYVYGSLETFAKDTILIASSVAKNGGEREWVDIRATIPNPPKGGWKDIAIQDCSDWCGIKSREPDEPPGYAFPRTARYVLFEGALWSHDGLSGMITLVENVPEGEEIFTVVTIEVPGR